MFNHSSRFLNSTFHTYFCINMSSRWIPWWSNPTLCSNKILLLQTKLTGDLSNSTATSRAEPERDTGCQGLPLITPRSERTANDGDYASKSTVLLPRLGTAQLSC